MFHVAGAIIHSVFRRCNLVGRRFFKRQGAGGDRVGRFPESDTALDSLFCYYRTDSNIRLRVRRSIRIAHLRAPKSRNEAS
jgi:hypothetical protein